MFITIFLSLILFTAIDLKYFRYPYIWESFFLGLYFLYFAPKVKRSWLKILLYNFIVFIFCIGLLELGAALSLNHDRFEGGYAVKNYFVPDGILGYAPPKNVSIPARRYHNNKLVYDVIYTINKDGLRIPPELKDPSYKDAVLFFGCSLTFGEGLNDNETVPYLVGVLSKSKVYNFGFHGYGPHQMLSAVEHGLVNKVVDCKPKYAIFQTGFFQVPRAAGYAEWDEHGPKYILSEDGRVKYAGHFDDTFGGWLTKKLLKRSAIYLKLYQYNVFVSKKDIDRYIAIVIASKNELQKEFSGLEFHIIYWNYNEDKTDKGIVERLQKEAVNVHLISDILPDFNKKKSDYQIGVSDQHPNFMANKYIANYIVRNILHKNSTP